MPRQHLEYPPKPSPGERVAVVSASSGLPALYPAPFELGLQRLRDDFQLEPVEYPTTRVMDAPPQARAADLHAAFADPDIKAVIASIGGDDQLKVLRHLDGGILGVNPKPFFGYSDNTNLLHYLWSLGMVGFHGGAVMVQWGRPGQMHPLTRQSLMRAMFTTGDYELSSPDAYTDEERSWDEPDAMMDPPPLQPAPPWLWLGPSATVTGPAWGGCLEIVDLQLRANRYREAPEAYDGAVLFLETSEELPDATYVSRVLMGMGERGLLERFAPVVMGRPKAWSLEQPATDAAKAEYVLHQHAAVLAALTEYNRHAVVVLDVDLGHTDPQFVIPHGGQIVVDGIERKIIVRY